MIVAIDGPAGSGKSTISKKVARRLKFFYLDTGAMYRAITCEAMRQGIDLSREDVLVEIARDARIDFKAGKKGVQKVYINRRDVTHEIRFPEVTNQVKHIAKIPAIREILVNMQRTIAGSKDVVLEGRDTTTVVFPNADYKIYLDADQKERARRRFVELQEKGLSVTFEEILADQKKRDESDVNRAVGPLKKAADAIILNTTDMTIEEVVRKILSLIKKRKNPKKNLFYTIAQNGLRVLLGLFFKYRGYGLEHIPRKGGFLLACNHASFLDPMVAGTALPRQIAYLARESLFKGWFGWLIGTVNAYPIKRDAADRGTLTMAEDLVKKGHGLLLFPEGTRSEDGTIQDVKSGIGFLACRLNCPVIPTFLYGTNEALGKHAKKLRFKRLAAVYGKPLVFALPSGAGKTKREYYQQASEQIMDEIRNLQRDFLSKVK